MKSLPRRPLLHWRSASALLVAALLSACATQPVSLRYAIPLQPEGSSGYSAKPGWTHQRHAVAAANPLATDAGLQVLRAVARRWMPRWRCRWC